MARIAVGLFDSPDVARRALSALRDELARVVGEVWDDYTVERNPALDPDELSRELEARGVPPGEARRFAEGARRGGAIVTAETGDSEAGHAVSTMNRFGAVDVELRSDARRGAAGQGRAKAAAAARQARSPGQIPTPTPGVTGDYHAGARHARAYELPYERAREGLALRRGR